MVLSIPDGYGEAIYVFAGESLPRGGTITMGHTVNPATDIDQLANDLFTAFETAWIAGLGDNNEFQMVKFRFRSDGNLYETESTGAATGSDTAFETPPPNVAALVKKVTSGASRQAQGRFFVPNAFLHEASIGNNGLLSSGALSDLQDQCSDWLSEVQTVGADPVILHPVGSALEDTPTPVTNFAAQLKTATQRRRLRRGSGRRSTP